MALRRYESGYRSGGRLPVGVLLAPEARAAPGPLQLLERVGLGGHLPRRLVPDTPNAETVDTMLGVEV
jgi:hypothetical protein